MAKTSGEFEKEFIETSKEKTGKSVEQWSTIIKESGLGKQKEIMDFLKKDYGMNHLQANLMAGIFINGGKPVFIDEGNLLDNQFVKCQDIRPLYEQVSKKIMDEFKDTQLIPKKTYISFTAKREFAAINVKPGEIRLGMDLGDMPFNDRVMKTKLSGPMPRISHMVVLKSMTDFDKELLELLKKSYSRVN